MIKLIFKEIKILILVIIFSNQLIYILNMQYDTVYAIVDESNEKTSKLEEARDFNVENQGRNQKLDKANYPSKENLKNTVDYEQTGPLVAAMLEYEFYDILMNKAISNLGYEKGSIVDIDFALNMTPGNFRNKYRNPGFGILALQGQEFFNVTGAGTTRYAGHRNRNHVISTVTGIGSKASRHFDKILSTSFISEDGTLSIDIETSHANLGNFVKMKLTRLKNSLSSNPTFTESLYMTTWNHLQARDALGTQVGDREGLVTVQLTGWDSWKKKENISNIISLPPKIQVDAKSKKNELTLESVLGNPDEYVDVSNRMKNGKLNFEWITKPNLSNVGLQKVGIRVTDSLGDYKNTADAEVLFDIVDNSVLTAEVEPLYINIGSDFSLVDPYLLIRNVKVDNTLINKDEYLTEVIVKPNMDTIGNNEIAEVKIILKKNLNKTLNVSVPINKEWGNTLHFMGSHHASVAGVSILGSNDKNLTLKSVRGTDFSGSSQQTIVHKDYQNEEYLGISIHEVTNTIENGMNLRTNKIGSIRGETPLENAYQLLSKNSTVNYGDIIEVRHKEVEEYSNMIALYSDNIHSNLNDDKKMINDTRYFEITKNGFSPLNINQLKSKKSTISLTTTDEELEKRLADFIDLRAYGDVELVGFSKYPNRFVSGQSIGIIVAKEKLNSGKYIQKEYEVIFEVIDGPLKISDVKSFDFGNVKKSGKNQTIYALAEEHPSLDIIDNSSIQKWSLQITQKGDFVDQSDNKLIGAEIILGNIKIIGDLTLNVNSDVVLNDFSQEIANYDGSTNSGKGKSKIFFGDKSIESLESEYRTDGVRLRIPGKTVKNSGSYKVYLEWGIVADPTLGN